MTDDTLKRLFDKQEALQRCLRPLSVRIQALRTETGIERLITDTDRMRNLMRSVLGPLEDIRRSRLLDTVTTVGAELQTLQSFGAELERQFRLPQLPEAADLLRALDLDGTARALAHFRNHRTELSRAIKAMTVPWLNVQDHVRSLRGFAGLQEIGHALNAMPVHDLHTAERLRHHLGDWRAPMDWPSAIFADPVARSDFYVDRGLDPALTDFPAVAFEQAVAVTDIKHPAPPRMDAYEHAPDDERDDEDEDFARNSAAHDRLQRFETLVRQFIDRQMTAAIGGNWIKHRVPGDMRRQWRDKQEKAREEGDSEHPLIAYADFTDYVTIILRKDNWNQVFKPIFRRETLVQESFQRLYPIRHCTMHARIITQDDELYLFTETRILLKAMGINA